jgi:two-component system phosphate regulon sensor histidine kinase PhoR
MKRHIFRRIFLLYLAILFLSAIFIELYITNVVRSNYLDTLIKGLSVQAGLLSEHISFDSFSRLDDLCRQLKQKTGARVTLINMNGEVLGDSDKDSSLMDNHSDRPEIQQALVQELGWSVRHSNTLRYDLLYVAKKILQGGKEIGIIRLSVPLTEVNRSINILRLKINLVVILLLLLFVSLSIWQTERIRKLVKQITEYSGALAHGFFKKRLFLEEAGEFTELAQNLNNMASELKDSIDRKNEETNRLKVILKSIPDALLLINVKGIIELANRAAAKLFGVEKLEGRPFIEVVRSPEFLSLIDSVRQNRQSGSAEIVIDFPEERYLVVRLSPLFYKAGEFAGIIGIFHDTTHMKRLEQMRKDFVVNVSHEIKTPVTAIKGFTETLLDGALYDKESAEDFLNIIKTHSERLDRLVEDLLTLSRIELHVIKMNKTRENLSNIIDRMIETFVVQAAEKNLTINKSIKVDDVMIFADRDRLEQMLLNLLDNAIKFTEKGEIEVGISKEGEKKLFYIRDSGIGIPQKYISRLGERFFRVDPSRSRALGGTGLGLAIVKHLIKAHGWDMKIESEVGKGTIVKVFY